jgi:AcrR family transcriptional regulator
MPSVTRRRRSSDPAPRSTAEEQILAATKRLLAGGASFTELGIQRIADEASLARSTFYVYFRDKTDLLTRMAAEMREDVFQMGGTWMPEEETASAGSLAGLYEDLLRYYRERKALLGAVIEVAAYDPEVSRFWTSRLDGVVDRHARFLGQEVSAGRAVNVADPDITARVMVWGADQALVRQVMVGDPATDVRFAGELALLQWYGAYRRERLG